VSLLARLGFLLALLGVGALARSAGLLTGARRDRLNAAAFYLVLPALLFDSIYDEPLEALLSPPLVGGLFVVFALTAGIAWVIHRRVEPRSTRSVALVGSYHTNFGYLGLPLVALTLGDAAAAKGGVILGFGALIQACLTVVVLVAINEADADVGTEVRKILTNPVVLALAAGLLVSYYDVPIPGTAASAISGIASVALPVALLLVGSALDLDVPAGNYGTVGSAVGVKVLLMPAIGWVTYTAFGVAPVALKAGVVMFAAPTALSTFIYAGELGGDERFASLVIFVSTLASIGTIFAVLQVLG
jgi:predicted permease